LNHDGETSTTRVRHGEARATNCTRIVEEGQTIPADDPLATQYPDAFVEA
jgi:hypothetical protein